MQNFRPITAKETEIAGFCILSISHGTRKKKEIKRKCKHCRNLSPHRAGRNQLLTLTVIALCETVTVILPLASMEPRLAA
jgi:hypothetical protein